MLIKEKICSNCNNGFAKTGVTCDISNENLFKTCVEQSNWQPIEETETPKELSTLEKIFEITTSLGHLLQYKNKKYGDSALKPMNIFSKLSAEEGIKIRLDDKIKRIISSEELRKNDVCDLMGYLVLLCASKNWLDFEEFKD